MVHQKLNERRLKNTFIVLSADHEESFEHGYFTHGGPFLYERVTHIPLIIIEPGQIRGQIVYDRVEQIDTAATILDLVNIPALSWMEGRSLVPAHEGESTSSAPCFFHEFSRKQKPWSSANQRDDCRLGR